MSPRRQRIRASRIVVAALFAACGGDDGVNAARHAADSGTPPVAIRPRLSLDELQNPETCRGCHPQQYAEWSRSMHAYAATDPVFLAMNKRGQRETGGKLGKFCVQCHAPMAVRIGATSDGLNLEEVAQPLKGVTCYFCHNALEAGGERFNANVTLANDDMMRGPIRDAVDPGVHAVGYSEAHDNRKINSSYLCGSCHDVVNDKGTHIERTLAEYEASIYNIAKTESAGGDTCQGCHMPWAEMAPIAVSADRTLPARARFQHSWPAVDVALSDFPDREKQRLETECALSVDGAYIFEITNDGQGGFTVSIETRAGHAQPSGVSQDRRFWVEVTAFDSSGSIMWESGKIKDGEPEEYPVDDSRHDPQLCIFRNVFEDESGKEVHMFWEAAKLRESASRLLPLALNPLVNHVATCSYRTPGRKQPARLAVRMRMRPVSVTILQDLVATGDLNPAVIAEMPTFTLHSTAVEWRETDGPIVSRPKAAPWPIRCN